MATYLRDNLTHKEIASIRGTEIQHLRKMLEAVSGELAEVRDKSAGKISSLEKELEELSEENQQLVADNIGYRDQIDLLTKECIDKEALELNHIGMIKTLTADRDHWQRRAVQAETRQAARDSAREFYKDLT